MSKIFSGCKSLESFPDISNWDTSKVIIINVMFSGCNSFLKFQNEISLKFLIYKAFFYRYLIFINQQKVKDDNENKIKIYSAHYNPMK